MSFDQPKEKILELEKLLSGANEKYSEVSKSFALNLFFNHTDVYGLDVASGDYHIIHSEKTFNRYKKYFIKL